MVFPHPWFLFHLNLKINEVILILKKYFQIFNFWMEMFLASLLTVYISQLNLSARVCSNVNELNNR